MSDDLPPSLFSVLNALGAVLQLLGVKRLPSLVFNDTADWLDAIDGLMPAPDGYGDPMVAGFRFRRSPASAASARQNFVDQEIGE